MGFKQQFGVQQANGKPVENRVEVVFYGGERGRCMGVGLRMTPWTLSRHTSAGACFGTTKLCKRRHRYEESK